MSKVIKIDLMKDDVNELIKKLENLKKEAEKAKDGIIKDLKEVGRDMISATLSSDPYAAQSNPKTSYYETKRKIGISGAQSVYDEFGTGTKGGMNPHPDKSSSSEPLNDYNSGKTIRNNWSNEKLKDTKTGASIPINTLYWTYVDNGQKFYTQGRPAGAYVYKGKKAIKIAMKTVNKKRVGELLSKL